MDFYISWVLNTVPIYKIIAFKYLKLIVDNRQNTLLRPSSWLDPHEMNYSRSVLGTEHGDISLDGSHWFGQSWSLCEENVLMWQSFKKEMKEPYVKIKVKPNSLVAGLNKKDSSLRICALDYIRYFHSSTADYVEKIKEVQEVQFRPQNFIAYGAKLEELYPIYSLLTKRDIFMYEEEVRLLLFDKSSTPDLEFIRYDFNPELIEEVIIDPWTSDNKVNEISDYLRSKISNPNLKIEKSNIFGDSFKYATRYTIK